MTLDSRSPLLAYGALALAALFWAGNMLTGSAVHARISPALLSVWRWLAILLLLFPFVATELHRRARELLLAWRILLLLALLSTGLFNAMVFLSLHHTSAANAALLNSSIPLWTILAAWCLTGETISVRESLGMLLSLAGVFVLLARGEIGHLSALHFNPGDVLMLGAMVMWGIYSVCLRRRPAGLSQFAYLWLTGAIGMAPLLPFAWIEIANGASVLPAVNSWWAIGYLVVFPSILATLLYNRALDVLGPARASHCIHLVPVYACLLGAIVLGDPIHLYHLMGFVLIVAGLGIAAASRQKA